MAKFGYNVLIVHYYKGKKYNSFLDFNKDHPEITFNNFEKALLLIEAIDKVTCHNNPNCPSNLSLILLDELKNYEVQGCCPLFPAALFPHGSLA